MESIQCVCAAQNFPIVAIVSTFQTPLLESAQHFYGSLQIAIVSTSHFACLRLLEGVWLLLHCFEFLVFLIVAIDAACVGGEDDVAFMGFATFVLF